MNSIHLTEDQILALLCCCVIIWLVWEFLHNEKDTYADNIPLLTDDQIWSNAFRPFQVILVDGEYEEFVLN